MQTHFSATTSEKPEQASAEDSSKQPDFGAQYSSFLEQVDSLLQAEQLAINELLPAAGPESDASLASSSFESSALKTINDLARKLLMQNGTSDPTEEMLEQESSKLSHLLSQLPFVKLGEAKQVQLFNPRSISKSAQESGAAQCFLVISLTGSAAPAAPAEGGSDKGESTDRLTLANVAAFVKESKYGEHLRLMSSIDTAADGAPSSPEELNKPEQARFFAQAHTYALAVQALVATDPRMSKLTSSYLEQAMSVTAPVFDPVKAAQKLSQSQSQQNASYVSAVGDQDLLRHNIAQMYQYYNQLIFRQGQNFHAASRFQGLAARGPPPTGQAMGSHRTVSYVQPGEQQAHVNRSAAHSLPGRQDVSMATHGTSLDGSMNQTRPTRDADQSRSRSNARTASENLLVSLDESILPPQITKVRPEASNSGAKDTHPGSPAKQLSVDGKAAMPPVKTLQPGQHPNIKLRYSKREIIQIFKGLGRFQSPLEHSQMYEIDMDLVGDLLRDKLLNPKPDVVLMHLRDAGALPINPNMTIQRKLFSTVESYYDSVSRSVPPGVSQM